jgi:UDP-glucose 4-epimerase
VNCLVSGATGFVGRHLCQYLRDRGESFTALSLSGGALPDGTPSQRLNLVEDALDQLPLAELDVVYHLAGIAHRQEQPSAYRELNYHATLRLAREAARQGCERFVFLSSVKAMGRAEGGTLRGELHRGEPVDPYGLWKWRAECALREEFANSPMAVFILRPSLVYGAGAKGNLALMARGVRAGLPRPPALGGRSMIAARDLARLLHMLGSDTRKGVSTWIACDGEAYSSRRLHDGLRAALGKPPARAWLPLAGWRLACALLDLRAGESRGTSFEKLFGTELYSNAELVAQTQWRPELQLEDEIPAMLACPGQGTAP